MIRAIVLGGLAAVAASLGVAQGSNSGSELRSMAAHGNDSSGVILVQRGDDWVVNELSKVLGHRAWLDDVQREVLEACYQPAGSVIYYARVTQSCVESDECVLETGPEGETQRAVLPCASASN